MLERGPHISFASCGLSYYISGEIANRKKLLVQTPERFAARFRVEARVKHEVLSIDRQARAVEVLDRETGNRYRQGYDKLVLSPGAAPLRPPLPGIDHSRVFSIRTIEDADRIRELLDTQDAGKAVVVGGGFIGLEMTEALHHRGLDVALVEMADQVMLTLDPEMAEFVHQHLWSRGIELRLGTPVESFRQTSDGRLAVSAKDVPDIVCDLAVLAIGVRPETGLARDAGLPLGPAGGIAVNEHLQTEDPDIYAIGDAVETHDPVTGASRLVPLAGLANKQGRMVADHIGGKSVAFPATLGTNVVRVFDLTVASTGTNEKTLRGSGRACERSYTHPASHAGYYPGATPGVLKILFAPADGRLLGAQLVGVDGVDKRIDVLATALHAGMTVEELTQLELAYAPQYGGAKDPVNLAGYVASNVVEGDVELFHAGQVAELRQAGGFLLDVRTVREFERGHIEGAVNIPIDEVRDRRGELPSDRVLLVYCLTGVRSYLACRILAQLGFRVRNLSGGYVIYCAVHPSICPKIPGLDRWKRLLALETFCSTPEERGVLQKMNDVRRDKTS
jgi:NADPH-dependent 2,4-dienoyl-CoA reductase/sulfur reductase-like enzyme/rhodanese-related sulfurtransferase